MSNLFQVVFFLSAPVFFCTTIPSPSLSLSHALSVISTFSPLSWSLFLPITLFCIISFPLPPYLSTSNPLPPFSVQILPVSAAERWHPLRPIAVLLRHARTPWFLCSPGGAGRLRPRWTHLWLRQRIPFCPKSDTGAGGEGDGATSKLQVRIWLTWTTWGLTCTWLCTWKCHQTATTLNDPLTILLNISFYSLWAQWLLKGAFKLQLYWTANTGMDQYSGRIDTFILQVRSTSKSLRLMFLIKMSP